MNRKKREQKILDAALMVFARQGYENTSVSGLVKEAQVSRGTFYLYFKSKKEIFDCLIDRFMGEVLHFVSEFDIDHINKDQDTLNSLSHELASCLTRYRLLARILMLQSSGIDTSHRIKMDAYIKQCYRILEYNIHSGIQLGEFNRLDASVLARCLVGTMKEFLLEWTHENDSYDLETRIGSFLRMLVSSLVAQQTPVGPAYGMGNAAVKVSEGDRFIEERSAKSYY